MRSEEPLPLGTAILAKYRIVALNAEYRYQVW
jgi:hypothetical protein